MNEGMKKLRDEAFRDSELQEQLQTSGHYFAFVEGFQTAHDLLMKDAEALVEALMEISLQDTTEDHMLHVSVTAAEALATWNAKYRSKK